jgi:hypothetical protein
MVRIKVPKHKAYVGLKVWYDLSDEFTIRGEIAEITAEGAKCKWENGKISTERGTDGIHYNIFYHLEPLDEKQTILQGTQLILIKKDSPFEEGDMVYYVGKKTDLLSLVKRGENTYIIYTHNLAISPGCAPVSSPSGELQVGDYVQLVEKIPGYVYDINRVYRIDKMDHHKIVLVGGSYRFQASELKRVSKPDSPFDIGETVKPKSNVPAHCKFLSSFNIAEMHPDGTPISFQIAGQFYQSSSFEKLSKPEPASEQISLGDYVKFRQRESISYPYFMDRIYMISKVLPDGSVCIGGETPFNKRYFEKVYNPCRYLVGQYVWNSTYVPGLAIGSRYRVQEMSMDGGSISTYLGSPLYSVDYFSPTETPPESQIKEGDYVALKGSCPAYKTDRIYRVSNETTKNVFTLGGNMEFFGKELRKVGNFPTSAIRIGDKVVVHRQDNGLLHIGDIVTVQEMSLCGTKISLCLNGHLYDISCFKKLDPTQEESINSQIKHTQNDNRTNSRSTESASIIKVQRTSLAIRSGQEVGGCPIRVRRRAITG